jgi:aryl carrier-like protein
MSDYSHRIEALSAAGRELLARKLADRLAGQSVLERGSGHKRLVAYLVVESGRPPTVGELQNHLATKLPEYMVPAAFVILDALPLTAGGKIDRRALPIPPGALDSTKSSYAPPQTEVEGLVAEVWREVLELERVGLYDNFFDLGGQSLLMVQVHSRLREKGQSNLAMIDLFKYPTVSALARFLSEGENAPVALALDRERVRSSQESSRRRREVRQRFHATKDRSDG